MNIKDKNLYYIGGVVRDEILGIGSRDIDLCYEGNAIEFASVYKVIKTNPDFGTVRILCDGKEIDIASTRTETYPQKGHLPKVDKIGCPLKEDLKRRDFTINAIAKRTTDGEIIDYFDGVKDIENKKLRVLHDNSFIDDPTRIIRGLKFSVRFGFDLDKNTKKLQEDYLNNVNYDMSLHRLKNELVDAFSLNKSEVLERFIEQKIYKLLNQDYKAFKFDYDRLENGGKIITPQYIWLLWCAGFDISHLPLTRGEKRILEWVKKLRTQEAGNNTPRESIIISECYNV